MSDQFSTTWTVPAETAGKTVGAALRIQTAELSWRQVKRLIETRRITVNGRLCIDEARRLDAGDQVCVTTDSLPKPLKSMSLVIRHLDNAIVVVEKPPGVISERHKREMHWPAEKRLVQPTIEEMLLQRLPRRRDEIDPATLGAKRRRDYIRCVHRLDQDTSGLLVFARTQEAEENLIAQFSEHTIERVYSAVVYGTPQVGTIESNLVRDRGDGMRGSTTRSEDGKRAVTIIRSVEPIGEHSKVDCELLTGRTHQIRIHLTEQGHPVCGDSTYRNAYGSPRIEDTSSASRLALHARRLAFKHPQSGQPIEFDAALPPDMSELIATLQPGC